MQILKFHRTGVSLLVVSSFATIAALLAASFALPLSVRAATSSSEPNFGQSVYVFNPSMSLSTIQAIVDAVASEQVPNQFGTQRYALLFEPGTYGSSATPLIFQVGYYTTVAGLGLSPSDVTINGEIKCVQPMLRARQLHRAGELLALVVEPDHQCDLHVKLHCQRRVLGGIAGRSDPAGPDKWEPVPF
jgi:hypothetical protein